MSYRIVTPRPIRRAGLDYDGHSFILSNATYVKSSIEDQAAGSWNKKRGVFVIPGYIVYGRAVLEIFGGYQSVEEFQVGGLDITAAAVAALDVNPQALPISADVTAYNVFKEMMYFFQQETVIQLTDGPKATGLVALSPGLGKTIVALVAARMLRLERVLIVAPKPLLRSWENEAMKFFKEIWFERRHGQVPVHGWNLANYDTVVDKVITDKRGKVVGLGDRLQAYMAVPWDLVILDESVLVKNRDSHRFKGMLALRKAFPKKEKHWWELSGYPATKYADDLWAQLHLQDPKGFASYWRFAQRFCYVEQDVWGTKITGTRQNTDIIGDLADVMFVRNQKDVLDQLPEEIHQLVEVELTPKQRKAYDEMSESFETELESGQLIKAPIVLAQLIRLQEITGNLANVGGDDESAKADAIEEMLRARSFDFPALIWTQWLPGADALWKRLCKVSTKQDGQLTIEWIHGAHSRRQDIDNEEKFEAYKAGNIDILILAMPVGKMGHNLQMTRTVIYHDKSWFADDIVQSMKRVKRMGLDHRPVVITVKAPGTTDDLIEDNLSGKFVGISKVANDDLAAMLRHLRGGR